ncbi:hypothetical protein DFH09DRAFT_1079060 [Mycena vulgaris]|nr:hypothetical protein DFH09DRAFT_1079060 [Mycena vulgaris]
MCFVSETPNEPERTSDSDSLDLRLFLADRGRPRQPSSDLSLVNYPTVPPARSRERRHLFKSNQLRAANSAAPTPNSESGKCGNPRETPWNFALRGPSAMASESSTSSGPSTTARSSLSNPAFANINQPSEDYLNSTCEPSVKPRSAPHLVLISPVRCRAPELKALTLYTQNCALSLADSSIPSEVFDCMLSLCPDSRFNLPDMQLIIPGAPQLIRAQSQFAPPIFFSRLWKFRFVIVHPNPILIIPGAPQLIRAQSHSASPVFSRLQKFQSAIAHPNPTHLHFCSVSISPYSLYRSSIPLLYDFHTRMY